MSWLNPLAETLDRAVAPVEFFFRDDDAGWGDDKLCLLLECFAIARTPLDLAVIPAACSASLAHLLLRWRAASGGKLGLHQHGFAHLNHEPSGRKCEFGASRSSAQQRADLREGQSLLRERFGDALDAIFTPPWNRCTQATLAHLAELGVRALSRDAGAAPLALNGLAELPVSVDWCRRDAGEPGWRALGERLAAAAARGAPVGVMLHHAVMADSDFTQLDELLNYLNRHECVRVASMRAHIPA